MKLSAEGGQAQPVAANATGETSSNLPKKGLVLSFCQINYKSSRNYCQSSIRLQHKNSEIRTVSIFFIKIKHLQ
jgi:hypothetical protein